MTDLVSIVIPTYNRSAMLPRALASVQGQTWKNLEIIVVDDGSTDDTAEVMAGLQQDDGRIHFLHHRLNRGAQAARNTGIQSATGRWLAFLDSDDEWLPHRLEAGLAALQRSGTKAVHCDCFVTNGDDPARSIEGIPPLAGNILPAILTDPGPMFQGLLTERTCLEDIGRLDETIVSYQEWDTYIRLAQFHTFSFIPEPLFVYHCHSGKTISQDMTRDADGYAQVVGKHHETMLRVAGKNVLKHHYLFLAQKNKNLGRSDLCRNYQRQAALL
jgi:glycosyltransferase involved in cell wall biosynthesis